MIVSIKSHYGQDTLYAIAYTGGCPFGTAYCTYDFDDRDTAHHFYVDTSQTNNIWQIGIPSKNIFNTAHSPQFSLITDSLNTYPINNISSFSFTLRSDDWTEINFWHRINSDQLNDGGVVEYSTDGGISWNNIINSPYFLNGFGSNVDSISSNSNKLGFSGTSLGWVNSSIQGYAIDYVKFRFTFTSDSINTNKDGWMIDDINISCTGTGINEIVKNSPFQVIPNPTSDFISVIFVKAEKFISATLFDVLGYPILTTNNSMFCISQFESGLYFLTIVSDKEKYVTRILIN